MKARRHRISAVLMTSALLLTTLVGGTLTSSDSSISALRSKK
jgi:hypothetical protein